jgi:hypothetical protein
MMSINFLSARHAYTPITMKKTKKIINEVRPYMSTPVIFLEVLYKVHVELFFMNVRLLIMTTNSEQ